MPRWPTPTSAKRKRELAAVEAAAAREVARVTATALAALAEDFRKSPREENGAGMEIEGAGEIIFRPRPGALDVGAPRHRPRRRRHLLPPPPRIVGEQTTFPDSGGGLPPRRAAWLHLKDPPLRVRER